jgi:hypothetical protein
MYEGRECVVPLFLSHCRGDGGWCWYCQVGNEHIDVACLSNDSCGCACAQKRVSTPNHGGTVLGKYLAQDRTHEHIGLGDEHSLAEKALL